jgi:hypothetical protein
MGVASRPAAKSALDVEKAPILPLSDVSSDEDVEDVSESKDRAKRSRRHGHRRAAFPHWVAPASIVLLFLYLGRTHFSLDFPFPKPSPAPVPHFIAEGIKQCEIISRPPPSPQHATSKRKLNDRFVPGTKAVWLKNATLWTGESDGEEVLHGVGVLLDDGVIRKIGGEDDIVGMTDDETETVDLHGAWVTPGIVDMHSHMGVDSAPGLRGSDDTNSLKSAVLPWLRSQDGFNTHDQGE